MCIRDRTKVGAIKMPGTKAWTDGEFTLPADANNKEMCIRDRAIKV